MVFQSANKYSVKDFLLDESFQELIILPKELISVGLTKWLEEHPDKVDIIDEARSMLLQLKLNFERDELQKDLNEVWARVSERLDQTIIGKK